MPPPRVRAAERGPRRPARRGCAAEANWPAPDPAALSHHSSLSSTAAGECVLVFRASEWADASLCDAYRGWFAQWAGDLMPAKRCALLLRLFGATTGAALRRETTALAGTADEPRFMPEAATLLLPPASSAAELGKKLSAALAGVA